MDKTANFCKACGQKAYTGKQQPSMDHASMPSVEPVPEKSKQWVLPVAILSGVAGLCVICLAVLAIILVFYPIGPARNPSYVLSSEQKKLIDTLGYPDEFVIAFDNHSKSVRSEVWTYAHFDRSFYFEQGDYGGSQRSVSKVPSSRMGISPDMFFYSMSPQQINALLGKGDEIVDQITYKRYLLYQEAKIVCVFDFEDRLIGVSKSQTPVLEVP